jgi:hypothetical protein
MRALHPMNLVSMIDVKMKIDDVCVKSDWGYVGDGTSRMRV